MKIAVSLTIMLLTLSAFGQNQPLKKEWYAGFDVGPKFDFYNLFRSKSSASSAHIRLINDVAATAGVRIGVNVDNRYNFETGIYRNNFVVNMQLSSAQGNVLFAKEQVNTLNSYLLPVNFNMHFPVVGSRQVFWVGGGLSMMLNPKTDFTGAYSSPVKTVESNGAITDQLQYNRYQHLLEGSIYTFNLNTGLDVSLFENFFLCLSLTGRLGIAGTDSYQVELNDFEGKKALYKISNNGSALQALVGFKYFFTPLQD